MRKLKYYTKVLAFVAIVVVVAIGSYRVASGWRVAGLGRQTADPLLAPTKQDWGMIRTCEAQGNIPVVSPGPRIVCVRVGATSWVYDPRTSQQTSYR